MIVPSIKQIISLHDMLIDETGGTNGLRDISLLESAINSVFITFNNISPYPTIESKTARLCYNLIKNHPFVDGNKRIGILVMLSTLELNNIFLQYTDDELITLGLNIASGLCDYNEILDWIINHN